MSNNTMKKMSVENKIKLTETMNNILINYGWSTDFPDCKEYNKQCGYCETEIVENAKFCHICGRSVEKVKNIEDNETILALFEAFEAGLKVYKTLPRYRG